MIKSIIKEIIIVLLLLIAIALALGVLFYDYIPTNKTVPSVGTYTTSETIKQELEDRITEDETVLVTYEITSNDLNSYGKSGIYKKGKANPFSTYDTEVSDNSNTVDGNNISDGNTTSTNIGTNPSNAKGNTFYNNTGTK